jgi:hypothetical protein
MRATDRDGRPVVLFESAWHLEYCSKQNPAVEFHAMG